MHPVNHHILDYIQVGNNLRQEWCTLVNTVKIIPGEGILRWACPSGKLHMASMGPCVSSHSATINLCGAFRFFALIRLLTTPALLLLIWRPRLNVSGGLCETQVASVVGGGAFLPPYL